MKRLILICLAAVTLAGCASGPKLPPLALDQGCRIFERPPYAVRGRTRYDQNVVDDYVESGVGACGWKRPAARPASLDAASVIARPVVAPLPPKRKPFLARIRDRVSAVAPRRAQTAQPVPSAPLPAAVEAPVVAAVPPAPPREADPIDSLLSPPVEKRGARRVY